MNEYRFSLEGADLVALSSGALWWPERSCLTVSDLHMGTSARQARRGGALLPPYETRHTLERLERDVNRTGATTVICLGDSFDTAGAEEEIGSDEQLWITRIQAGRTWLWIEGNHDPGPVALGGTHCASTRLGPLSFRHIAEPDMTGEISGHYHPKFTLSARGRSITRPCFAIDDARVVLPAYGAFTGGLRATDPVFTRLLAPGARAVLTGRPMVAVPFFTTP